MSLMTEEIMSQCTSYIKSLCYIAENKDIIIDPCAGKGDLKKYIEPLARFCFNYDAASVGISNSNISNSNISIGKLDFRTVDFNRFEQANLSGLWYDKVHIISCPPGTEAFTYLEKCSEFADSIAFILPHELINMTNICTAYKIKLLVEIDANWVLKIWDKPVNKNWN